MIVVAIHGRAYSGKDTLAKMLAYELPLEHGLVPHLVRFADPIKEACKILWGFTDEQLSDPMAKATPDPRYLGEDGRYVTPRLAMQLLGTEYARSLCKNVWGLRLKERLRAIGWSKAITFIPDLRFPNEHSALYRSIEEDGWKVVFVHIIRPDQAPLEGGHSSEAGLTHEPFHFIVENNGSLEDLRVLAKGMAKQIAENAGGLEWATTPTRTKA